MRPNPDYVSQAMQDFEKAKGAWPYDAQLKRLRRLHQSLSLALDAVEQTGKWMSQNRLTWPSNRTAVTAQVRKRLEATKAAVQAIRWQQDPP